MRKVSISSFLPTFIISAFALVFSLAFAHPAFATDSTPASCLSPQGTIIAQNNTGSHGVIGEKIAYSGSDSVYQVSSSEVLQCLCTGNQGIQTNWLHAANFSVAEIASKEAQGWIYINSGLPWGLDDQPYLAQNISYSCGGSNITPTATPSVGSSNTNSFGPVGGSTPYVCNDNAPSSAPVITNITYGQNAVTLTWTKAADPVSYYLVAYGTHPGVYTYGNPNVGGPDTTSYTITNLSGNTTYYFVVRAGNGCKPGPFSNEISSTPTGGYINGPAAGFISNVLGAESNVKGNANKLNTLCTQCIWLPILLVEIIILILWYLFARSKVFRINKHIVGGIGAILAYIVFLILNRGHICPIGGINLLWFSIPCKYFWVLDLIVYIAIGLTIRVRKSSPIRKAKSPQK